MRTYFGKLDRVAANFVIERTPSGYTLTHVPSGGRFSMTDRLTRVRMTANPRVQSAGNAVPCIGAAKRAAQVLLGR